ncbi:copper resistance protein NlpE [Flavobacterium sp. MK4S-17]|uniref:copper resistance protein NlpE n=1 Tax=Flavobacterium sp. MK4S-17 TaxID=2543737 RepID=UPI00135A99B2|nr:copper resistance protein NlpE [Flavobacterium sp. MK4S-17]
MKQLLYLFAFVSLIACKDGKKADAGQNNNEPAVEVTELQNDKAPDMHNSANSLDWVGEYSGILSCWNGCEGYKHIIELKKDSTYTLTLQALGIDDKPRTLNGKFNWSDNGSIITLDAEGDHLKFKVMENMLKKLDKFGNEEQGAPQAKYLLHKVQ